MKYKACINPDPDFDCRECNLSNYGMDCHNRKIYFSKIKSAREVRGWSQPQLAEKAGISVRTLQNYERGARDPAKAEAWIIIALAEALGVEPKELI